MTAGQRTVSNFLFLSLSKLFFNHIFSLDIIYFILNIFIKIKYLTIFRKTLISFKITLLMILPTVFLLKFILFAKNECLYQIYLSVIVHNFGENIFQLVRLFFISFI